MSKSSATESLVIRNKVMFPIVYAFMGLCLLLASVLVLTQPLPHAENPLLLKVFLGGLGLPFSLWLVGSNASKAILRKDAIVIDAAGITDRTGALAPGRIAWEDVAEVYLLKLKDDTYLCAEPVDYDAWSASLSRGQRRLAEANRDAGFAPIRIQFKKVTERFDARDGLEVVKALHPEKVTRMRKPKY